MGYRALLTSLRESYRRHDPGAAGLRRALRAAIVMPILFALADRFGASVTFTLFAAFGSLAVLLLVGFSGSTRERLTEAGVMLGAELALICVGTVVSRFLGLAVACTAAITFGVYYLSIPKPSLKRMATSLLISFVLPVTLPAGIGALPERFAAWLLAGVVGLITLAFLFPSPAGKATGDEPTLKEAFRALRTIPTEAKRHPEQYEERLRHAVRAAVALALSVLTAGLSHADHSLWIVLSSLSVLCAAGALGVGRNAVGALIGTAIGVLIAVGLIALIGENRALCWALLPVAVLYAGIASLLTPTRPSGHWSRMALGIVTLAAGQAGFTTLLLLVSHIATPIGWRIGLVRLENVLIGCAVALVVGALFREPGTVSASAARTPARGAAV